MKIIDDVLENFEMKYDLKRICDLHKLLFFDIETTGFSASTCTIYIIGCVYYEDTKWHVKQWLAENYEEEKPLLEAFMSFSEKYSMLIHFNGNQFDLPFVEKRAKHHNLENVLVQKESLDIYKKINPYRFFCSLPSCRQKTIEEYLGIHREDEFNGGQLIEKYHSYVKDPTPEVGSLLLLHNHDDLIGMLSILPILSIPDLFQNPCVADKVQANTYRDLEGNTRKELLISVTLPCSLPVPISCMALGCYFKAQGNKATIKVPIIIEEMKYFYSNYKEYYYLPVEDLALHKSVASFVDKEFRVQATAATCYTRKYSEYLPQWNYMIEPYFRREYKSKELFFELTDELKSDKDLFTLYANHILHTLAETY